MLPLVHMKTELQEDDKERDAKQDGSGNSSCSGSTSLSGNGVVSSASKRDANSGDARDDRGTRGFHNGDFVTGKGEVRPNAPLPTAGAVAVPKEEAVTSALTTDHQGGRGEKEAGGEREGTDVQLPCASTSFAKDGQFMVLRANRELCDYSRRGKNGSTGRHDAGRGAGVGPDDSSPVRPPRRPSISSSSSLSSLGSSSLSASPNNTTTAATAAAAAAATAATAAALAASEASVKAVAALAAAALEQPAEGADGREQKEHDDGGGGGGGGNKKEEKYSLKGCDLGLAVRLRRRGSNRRRKSASFKVGLTGGFGHGIFGGGYGSSGGVAGAIRDEFPGIVDSAAAGGGLHGGGGSGKSNAASPFSSATSDNKDVQQELFREVAQVCDPGVCRFFLWM